MKKLLIILAVLFVACTAMSQEKYYGQVKQITKEYGKTKTCYATISITIDEEYRSVSVSMEEPLRYTIDTLVTDTITGDKIAVLKLKSGSGLLEATLVYNEKVAKLNNTQSQKPIIFDSRERPSIRIN